MSSLLIGDDGGQYKRLLQSAALDDPDDSKVLELIHWANSHIELDSVELEILLEFLRVRCERTLRHAQQRTASSTFLAVQFGTARLIAVKAKNLQRCLSFLIQFSISWPICEQLPAGQSIVDLIALIDAGKQAPIIQNEIEVHLIRLLAVGFILTKQPGSALSILSQIRDCDEPICLLISLALYYKSKLLGDAGLIDLALDALSSELDGKSSMKQPYKLHFMKGYLLCCESRFIEAIGSFKTCLSGDYRRHESCLIIGVCLIESESFDAAVEYLQRAIMDQRLEGLSAYNVAVVKERQSKHEEAVTLHSAILEECSSDSENGGLSRESVIGRLINLCLIQSKAVEALKFVEMLVSESRPSLGIARIHIYVMISCSDRSQAALTQCESYLSSYQDDIVLVLYLCEILFVLQRFDECITQCDRVISLCSSFQESKIVSEPRRKQHKTRETSRIGFYHDSPSLNIPQMKAYMNKGLCFVCLSQNDQAIVMMQWALFHHQSKEAEFNLCALLIKTGRIDIGCARWLQYKGFDLSLPGRAYKEHIDRLADASGGIRPRSHVAARLTDEQDRAMTKLVLEQWVKIRSDHVFTKSLQNILQSCY